MYLMSYKKVERESKREREIERERRRACKKEKKEFLEN